MASFSRSMTIKGDFHFRFKGPANLTNKFQFDLKRGKEKIHKGHCFFEVENKKKGKNSVKFGSDAED